MAWFMKVKDADSHIHGGGYTEDDSTWSESGYTVVPGMVVDIPELQDADGNQLKKWALVTSGTADGASDKKLINSGDTFTTDAVVAGDIAVNTTDGTTCVIKGVDSETQLDLWADIFSNGDVYEIRRIEDV